MLSRVQKEETEMKNRDGVDVIAFIVLLLLLSLGVYCMVRMFRDSDSAQRKARVVPLGSAFNSH
jgi:ABC-type Na+ efflux pump permease subunit